MKKWYEAAKSWLGERSWHFYLAMGWVTLAIPTVGWWKTSILWVAIMSLYANYESSMAADAARREKLAMEKKWADMMARMNRIENLIKELNEDAVATQQADSGKV